MSTHQSPHRVLTVGLPDQTVHALARRLRGAAVESLARPAALPEALAREAAALIVIAPADGEPIFPDLLAALRRHAPPSLPLIYVLERSTPSAVIRQLIEGFARARILYRPIDAGELARLIVETLGAPAELISPRPEVPRSAAAAAIGALWERYRDVNLQRVSVLEEAAAALRAGSLDPTRRQEAARAAHKLAGAVGTFGFTRGSETARTIEQMLAGSTVLSPAQGEHIAALAAALRRELSRPPPALAPPPAADTHLLVISADRELTHRLSEAARHRQRIEVAASLAAARLAIAERRPNGVLLDLDLADPDGGALTILAELNATLPDLPVIVLTAWDSFADQIQIARLGGRGFLRKSMPPARVLEEAEQLLSRFQTTDATVLAVDDDPQVLEALRAILAPRGFILITLDDPLRIWDVLSEAAPDLIILDVDMPLLTGIEICRVIRSDPRWAMIPILFLTARTDPETVARVFAAGADDFVTKPVVVPELVTRINNRLERVRLYRSLAETDFLTGVANPRRASQVLEQLMQLAQRHAQTVSIAILDLDHFKQINDRHGHDAGDAVLRQVGGLLRQRFRGGDLVARWGGEEFILAMYAMGKDDALRRVTETLEAVRQVVFTDSGGGAFGVTFSAGIAAYPSDGTDSASLFRAADAALYQAKEAGRNRVVPAGWMPPPTEVADIVIVDDDDAVAGLLVHALEGRGYRLHRFHDGAAAAAALLGDPPPLRARVVLLDVDLPGLDGLELLERLAAAGIVHATRVIMLTARSAEADILRALDLGAFDYITKPFSLPLLVRRVRAALER
jgi:diguanylate cyclase (GGDEF)-like protein